MPKTMQMMKTSEFARFCSTTRDTLLWYDKVGILKPAEVHDNGYRYYTPNQYFDFFMISILKETGNSVQEIAEYRRQAGETQLYDMLETRQEELEQKFCELQRARQMLDAVMSSIQEAMHCEYEVPSLVTLPRQGIVTTPASEEQMPWSQDWVGSMALHIQRYEHTDGIRRYPFCVILNGADYGLRQPADKQYFFVADDETATDYRPAGDYVQLYHRGDYFKLWENHKPVTDFMAANHLRLCGDIYEYDILTDLMGNQEDDYVCKLLFPVCPA